jgi:Holliday junction resolvasome RuvABC endonuclease subunit
VVVKGIVPERDANRYTKILGVDTSTQGIAWTQLYKGHASGLGKIELKQKDIIDKLAFHYSEWAYMLDELKPSHVFIEKSIFVKNPDTARKLSFVVGTIAAITKGKGYEVTLVEPGTWKAFLGYTNLSSKFVQQAKAELGNTEGKKFCDRLRKSQTWRVIKHNFPDQVDEFENIGETDNDIADAWGIALYGYNLLAEELQLEKGKEISLDVPLMATLGLAL